jgi:hypothetical protein
LDLFDNVRPVPVAFDPLQRNEFAVCRERSIGGCGGHHERGPVVAGCPIVRWICCADCPARSQVASAIEAAAVHLGREAAREKPP